jgi:curved DNA-binding protein CbpA
VDSKGYYLILDVAESASYQEIKRSYRRLARKYHPDRNNSSYSEDMIKKINAAFEILSDREKRQQYDKMNYENVQIQVDHEDMPNQYGSEPFSNNNNNNNNSHVDTNYNNEYSQYTAAENVRKGGGSNIHDNIRNNYMWNNRSPKINTGFLDTPKGRFHIIVEPSLCMAFGSCETLAPKVFVVEKHKMFNPKAKVESETGADFESILSAAQTCPTKAIKIIDRYTGEQIYP